MISKFKFLLLTALTLPLVLSCGKEGGSNEGPSRPDSAISVNPTSLTLRQEGETQRVSVKASGKWAINGSVPWLQISPDTSDGDEIISITAGENPDTDERNATLTLICGDASAKLTVIQKQKDALTVTSNKQEVEAVGGTVDIEVKSNVEYTIEIDSACKDWISQTGTKSMLTTHVILDVAQNMDFEKREGKVTIRSGNLSEVVTIYQDGSEPVIVISQSEYTLPASESELKIEIKSNVEVSAAIQQGVDWISRNETKSVSTSTFHYSVMANTSEEPRSAEIIFSNSEYNLRDVVKVTQLPKSAIVVAKTSYEIDSNGGTLTFPVQHNTEYLVDISETWVKREQTKAMQTTNEVFTVEANTSYDSRTATITFTSSDNAVRQVVTLTQEQLDIVLPEKENIEIKGEGGNFDIKLQTNAQYTVEISDETWIHQITEQTKSLVSNTLHFTADANTTGEDRTGWIRIKIDGSDEVVAIKVSQPAVETAQSNSIYNVGPEGGYVNVNLVTNIPFYTLEITPAEASYWLEQVSTKSTRTDVLTFNVAKNIEYESREATVKVKSNSTSAVVTSFVIKQNPQPIPGNVIIYTTKYDYELSLKVTTGYGANLMENTYKDGLGKLVFDDDVKTIPANAFSGLNTLTSIILPNCTWSIGSKAFYNCASMIDLTIPESVTTIASDAFSGCTGTLHCNCNSIEIGGNSFSAVEIGANVTLMPVLRCSYEMKNVVFLNPDNIKAIPANCFQDCRALETIVLPSAIETIGELAFQNCYALKTLTIPDKVKKIEQSTFSNCSELETVTFPSGFTSIGDGAFASSGIKYITIPANVTSLGKQCFMSCRNLQTLTFEKGSKLSTITGGYSSGTPYGAFYDCSALKNVTIPANVNTIAASAFGECAALESVTVEDGGKLSSIGGGYYGSSKYYGAFTNCTAIKSVSLGNSLTVIGEYAFYNCSSLKSIDLGSKLNTIGNNAFANSGLENISIPASVSSLGKQCFFSCRSLQTLTFEKGSKLSIITGGYSNRTPYGAFCQCTALKNVIIPANVSSIEASAFYGCSSLKTLNVENGGKLREIGGGKDSYYNYFGAFSYCSALETISLGSNISTIGPYAFYYCKNLKNATIESPSAPVLNEYSFGTSDAILNCPQNEEWAYSCAGYYAYFSNIPSISYTDLSLDCSTSSSATFKGSGISVKNATGREQIEVTVYCNTSKSQNNAMLFVLSDDSCTMTNLSPGIKYYYWCSCSISYNGKTYIWPKDSDVKDFTLDYDMNGDLGLSVNWATCNIGASSPEDYGRYFNFGDTIGQIWNGSSWSDGGFNNQYPYEYNNGTLTPDYDAAHALLGERWRIPTEMEWRELMNNCTWIWTTLNGVTGYKIVSNKLGYTNNSIFLPAAGVGLYANLNNVGSHGYYWSSSHVNYQDLYGVLFYKNSFSIDGHCKGSGQSIRPIWGPAVASISLNSSNLCLVVGASSVLEATVLPENAGNMSVTWNSSDNGIVTVSSSGKVEAVSEGTAIITACTNDGSYTATCCVNVTKLVQTDAVDLGLSVKWASCNLGALKPEEYGSRFGWGDIGDGKYYRSNNKLPLSRDAAHVILGGSWRIPTTEECEELINNCISSWITINGVNGKLFTSKKLGFTNTSIFFPAAGGSYFSETAGSCGRYWLNGTPGSAEDSYAPCLYFHSRTARHDAIFRSAELPIRPICE